MRCKYHCKQRDSNGSCRGGVGVVGVVVVYIVVVSSMTWCAKDNITLSLIAWCITTWSWSANNKPEHRSLMLPLTRKSAYFSVGAYVWQPSIVEISQYLRLLTTSARNLSEVVSRHTRWWYRKCIRCRVYLLRQGSNYKDSHSTSRQLLSSWLNGSIQRRLCGLEHGMPTGPRTFALPPNRRIRSSWLL